MSKLQRRRAEELFHRAADLPPEQRPSFLAEHCADDSGVRAEVESLLRHLEEETVASLHPLVQDDGADAELVGQHIGSYKLLQLIGEGGFGSVYMAEQEEPVRRMVALKIIKLGMDTKQVIARFEAERQALALMEHPNIARVLDAGATDTGRPYFVMELVRGIPITKYCDQNNLPMRERLDLFTQVCRAVQHAHQKGVIHRDIKPSNVMVTLHDGTPVPKVIDFGIAKAMSQRLTERTLFTEFLQFIGTPEYMSPEQAEMSGLDIDTRTDIYSLGVLLYELLTGTTPFDATVLRSAAYGEIQRIIREQDPPTPSRRVSTLGAELPNVAKCRHTEPSTLSKLMRGDLDWIVMRALEKDRTRRYDTAAGLAADIQRHLNHEPVLAGPPGAAYKLRKFVRRNQTSVLAGSVVTAAVLIGCALATIGFIQARTEAERATREAESTQAINAFFNDMLVSVDPMQLRLLSAFALDGELPHGNSGGFARDVSVAEMVRGASDQIDAAFVGKPELEATARETIGMTLRGLGRYADARPQLQAALDLRRRILGNDHPDTLRARLALGDLLFETGRPAEGEPLVRAALEGMQRIHGAEHPKTLSCASILAAVLSDEGKFEESETLFRDTLAAQRRVLGAERRDTLATMWKWSVAQLWQRKLNEGQALARELYDISSRTLSPHDSLNILCQPLLGWWHVARFEYEQAENVLRPALEQCRRMLGAEHPFTYMTMQGLARSLQGQDLQQEKEQLYRDALAGLRATRGRLHWQTISTTVSFAQWLDSGGRFDEAGQLYRAAVDDCSRAWGECNDYTLRMMATLAGFLERAGKLDEAASVLRERLAIMEKNPQEKPLTVYFATNELAQALVRMGKVDEGRRVTQELIDSEKLRADAHPDDPLALNSYAWTLLACTPADMRDPARALPVAKKAVERSDAEVSAILDTLALAYHLTGDNDRAVETQLKSLELLPRDMASDLDYGAHLVRYLLDKGDQAAADEFVLKGVDMYRTALGEDNPLLAVEFNNAAVSLGRAGNYALAEGLLREAVELNRKLLGPRHEQVALTLANLAAMRCSQNKYEQAVEDFRAALALRRELLGDDDWQVAWTQNALGIALWAAGDLPAAVKALSDVVATYRRLQLEHVPAALESRRELADILIASGRFAEAEAFIQDTLAETRALYGDDHASTAKAMRVLGSLLLANGHADQAEPILRESVAIFKRLGLPEHEEWWAAEAENTLGCCLTALQHFDQAEPLLLESYQALSAARGESYRGTRAALERLVNLYETWGRPEQASAWRAKLALLQPVSRKADKTPADSR
jgi:serine/threonine protein kinase/tetratricopeptide (TPR) repeat protein